MSMAAKNGSDPGQPLGDAPEVAVLGEAHSANGCPCCSWGVQLRSPGPTGEILHCLNNLDLACSSFQAVGTAPEL